MSRVLDVSGCWMSRVLDVWVLDVQMLDVQVLDVCESFNVYEKRHYVFLLLDHHPYTFVLRQRSSFICE